MYTTMHLNNINAICVNGLSEICTVKIITNRHLEVLHVLETRWRRRSGAHLAKNVQNEIAVSNCACHTYIHTRQKSQDKTHRLKSNSKDWKYSCANAIDYSSSNSTMNFNYFSNCIECM